MVIGDEADGGLRVSVNVECAKDANSTKELAVVLELGLHLTANFTFDNFRFWANLNEPTVLQTKAESKVEGLILNYHNWDLELSAVVKGMVDDFNLRWNREHDLRNKYKIAKYKPV